MNRQAELEAHRRNTAAHIERDPNNSTIVLSREDLVAGGGSFQRVNQRRVTDQRVWPHRLRLGFRSAGPSRARALRSSFSSENTAATFSTEMRFYLEGVKYEVVFVHPDRSYQTKAEVVYRRLAPSPGGPEPLQQHR